MSAHPTSHSIAVFDEAQVMHVAYPSGETYYSLVGLALGLALSALSLLSLLAHHPSTRISVDTNGVLATSSSEADRSGLCLIN